MPSAPKQPCKTPGCGNLVDSGVCPSCKTNPTITHERKTANERGYNYRWQKASKAFLKQNPIAVDYFNEHNGRIFPAECVDHIIPHRGDPVLFWSVSNWQPMTIADHNRKTALEDGGFGHTVKT